MFRLPAAVIRKLEQATIPRWTPALRRLVLVDLHELLAAVDEPEAVEAQARAGSRPALGG